MRHTNQQPFGFDLPQPAQQKLAKASHMLDLRKDRFDDHLSSAEHFSSGLAGQLVPHPFLQRGVCRQRRVLLSLEWLTLIWWHMKIDASYGLMSKGGSAVVAGIGRGLHRQAAQISFHLAQHRHQLFLVHTRLHYFGSDDDLRLRIYSDLNVIGLLESLTRMVFHDARVGIGEIAFALWRRQRLARVNYFARPELLALLFCLLLFALSFSSFFLCSCTC